MGRMEVELPYKKRSDWQLQEMDRISLNCLIIDSDDFHTKDEIRVDLITPTATMTVRCPKRIGHYGH